MSYVSPSESNQSLIAQADEDIRVLGQTGQTVVYMFPDGRGLAEREKPDFDAIADPPTNTLDAPITDHQLLAEMVAAGQLSEAQKAVVLHDQEMTNMSIEEILTARGWL